MNALLPFSLRNFFITQACAEGSNGWAAPVDPVIPMGGPSQESFLLYGRPQSVCYGRPQSVLWGAPVNTMGGRLLSRTGLSASNRWESTAAISYNFSPNLPSLCVRHLGHRPAAARALNNVDLDIYPR